VDPLAALASAKHRTGEDPTEHLIREAEMTPTLMETTMCDREFEPAKTGRGDPQQRDGTPQNEARHQVGTPTTRGGKIEIDQGKDTGNQPYAIRHLVSRYSVSAALAAIIAAKLGIGGGV
jgi:hypothetical protein